MRASNIALIFVAALGSAFAGSLVGGFAAGLTGNVLLFPLLLLPASLLGRWLARRQDTPSPIELTIGCLAYLALGSLTALGTRNGAGLAGFVVCLAIAWMLRHVALRAPRPALQPAG